MNFTVATFHGFPKKHTKSAKINSDKEWTPQKLTLLKFHIGKLL